MRISKQIRLGNTQDIPCPYCKGFASLQDSTVIHKNSSGKMYICNAYPGCDSYVGAHKESLKPFGTLADKDLRQWRITTHEEFDLLWSEYNNRKRARSIEYSKLSKHLGIQKEDCHIGYFDILTCKEVIEYSKNLKKKKEEKAHEHSRSNE